MVTAVTPGYIYFIESDAGDNQNWLTDPDTIDLDQFTEGTDYCKLRIPEEWQKHFNTGIEVLPGSAGSTYDQRTQRRFYTLLANGIETSTTNADLVEGFFMSARHTSGSLATFVRYYMVICRATGVYINFTDASGTRREYCPCVVTDGNIVWRESSNMTSRIRLNVASVW